MLKLFVCNWTLRWHQVNAELLESGRLADKTLLVRGVSGTPLEFAVHSLILASRLEHFKQMFFGEFVESDASRVEIGTFDFLRAEVSAAGKSHSEIPSIW